MTRVVIKRKENHIIGVECSGHTGYAEAGEDIVCAALSSIVQTALLGLLQVAGIKVRYTRDDKAGGLKMTLPELPADERRDADMILDTMAAGIADLNGTYSDYIELEVE